MAREQRRLAAILAADVVSYSRLMGRDENGTLARLREHRKQRFKPILSRHGGRLVKLMGDGALAEFPSAVDALSAAIEVQQAMAEANDGQSTDTAIVFRIGLHLGDLIVDGDDLYGDGVNVAARLEGEASPGGIVISAAVYDATGNRLAATFEDLGRVSLKNIERPVQAYAVHWQADDWPLAGSAPDAQPAATASPPFNAPLALPDKPSIAVLPFQNMSGDPEQEYFADGIVEEIITALSRFKSLFVIARNSSFAYKGKSPDIRQVGRELGVRYVLEGSVRKAGSRVRITGQLIQADSGSHIWADHYNGDLSDIFDLQDKVSLDVVGAITPKLEQAEIERVRRKPTDNLGAYDCYLRAIAIFYRAEKETLKDVRHLCLRAIELDSGFAAAHALAAATYTRGKGIGLTPDEGVIAETARLARRAVALDRDDSVTLSSAGWALAFVVHDLDVAAGWVDRALKLNPNLATAWMASGQMNLWLGKPDLAVEHFARSMRLSPLDPYIGPMRSFSANSHMMAGRYDEAAALASRALEEWQSPIAYRIAAACAALAGRSMDARKLAGLFRQLDPVRRVSNLTDVLGPYRRPADIERVQEAMRLAGLPE